MSAAPAYIRSIQTSFTAAHPTWAAASINSHNQNTYQHHLHQYGGPTIQHHHGRRRSASIRHAPPHHIIKFDPFADEPPVLTAAAPPNDYPHTTQRSLYSQPRASVSTPMIASSAPYTIQIPPAGPTEIQRYHHGSSTPNGNGTPNPRRFASLSSPSTPHLAPRALPSPSGGGGSGVGPVARPISSPRSSIPSSMPANNATRMTGALSGPNISKLVAGILLNRVHTTGKPMRRRFQATEKPRDYVKSCLSSVVCVEA